MNWKKASIIILLFTVTVAGVGTAQPIIANLSAQSDPAEQCIPKVWWETEVRDRQVTITPWDGGEPYTVKWPDAPIIYRGVGNLDYLFIVFTEYDKRVRTYSKKVDSEGNEYYKLENYIFEFKPPSPPGATERRVRANAKITFTKDDIPWTDDDNDYKGLRMAIQAIDADMYQWKLQNNFYAWEPMFHFSIKSWAPKGRHIGQ